MKKIFFCLLLLPFWVAAQENEADSLKTKASLSITGFWQDGNVQTFIFRTSSDIRFKSTNKWDFRTKNSYVYQAFGGTKADEDILSLNFLSFNNEKKFHPIMLGFISTNFRREIEVRYLLGLGITYQIYRKEEDFLKFSLTSEFEQTNFNKTEFNIEEYNGSETIDTYRSTIWISGKYHLFDKKVILRHESFYQPSLGRSNNYR